VQALLTGFQTNLLCQVGEMRRLEISECHTAIMSGEAKVLTSSPVDCPLEDCWRLRLKRASQSWTLRLA
jgi:hypothetical protein